MYAEVDVEVRAAELAVRHGPDAIVDLALDHLRNMLILNLPQLCGGELAVRGVVPSVQHRLGP